MNAFQDSLHIDRAASQERISLAASLIQSSEGSVVLENVLALWPSKESLRCEVIDTSMTEKSELEYMQMVSMAKDLLDQYSELIGAAIGNRPKTWSVVYDYGMGRATKWSGA